MTWARGLADRFRVYLPFHPGFGESGEAPHIAGMQDMVGPQPAPRCEALGLEPAASRRPFHGWMDGGGNGRGRRRALRPAGAECPGGPQPSWTIPPPIWRRSAAGALPGYLAHNVDVALRYFPGGAECPPLEEFLAARARRKAAALGNILRVARYGHPQSRPLAEPDSRMRRSSSGGRQGSHACRRARRPCLGRALIPNAPDVDRPRGRPFRHAGRPATVVTAIGDFLAG